MTVIANNARNQYTAVASQTIFNYTFEITNQNYLKVYLTPAGDTPNDATDILTVVTDYTVTGVGSTTGGTIILTTPATAGDTITIQGNTPNQRTTSFTPGGVIQAENLNTEFDNLVLITQTTDGILNKIVPQYQEADIVLTKDRILPTLGANQGWVMNADNTAIEAVTIGGGGPGGPYLPLAGGEMTGALLLAGPASEANEAVTLAQLEAVSSGNLAACNYSTTANLSGYAYSNGTSGVGATLTAGSNGAFTTDGKSPGGNSRIFVPFQTTKAQNGLYELTTVGDASTKAVLTRTSDFNEASEMMPGAIVKVLDGNDYAATQWMFTSATPITVGTTDLIFTEVGSQDALLRANNLSDVDSASTSRANLGVAIGTDVQAYNSNLQSISALGTAANKIPYTTGVDTWAETGITAFGRTVINEPDAASLAALLNVNGITSIAFQAFTSGGTYTPTTNMKFCRVIAIGGGGGGGGSTSAGAGGGGGGGYAEKDFTAAQIGVSQTVTIGAGGAGGNTSGSNGGNGGTTTFGALLTATGGAGGNGGSGSLVASGGAGGAGSGGISNASGGHGSCGTQNTVAIGGDGGAPICLGAGGTGGAGSSTGNVAATDGVGFGGGGGGAAIHVSTAAGGNGSSGVVYIYEYISA